jgi:hypothetical protein
LRYWSDFSIIRQEFKERVSRQRKIILTDKLTHAFKMAKVTVTSKEEKQEEVLLSGTLDSTSPLNALFPSLQKKQEELTNMQEHYLEILKSIARSKE